MNDLNSASLPPEPATYTPGYANAKKALLAGGLLLAVVGLWLLTNPLQLVLLGKRTRAEVVRVVKEKPGVPPVSIDQNALLAEQLEPRDRSFVFWNEFRFNLEDGTPVQVRANVGSLLRPLYPLMDADGLPASDLLFYNPNNPKEIILPFVVSTWLAPLVLTLSGILISVIASFLLYWSTKPIELPRLPASERNLGDNKSAP